MSGANTRSVAWFGVGFTSLAVSWLGNWGESWGPYPVDEGNTYYGSGKRIPYREKDPFLTDDEHLALVREKWEAIERATAKDSLPVADHLRDATKKIEANHIEDSLAMVSAPSIIAEHWPVDDTAILRSRQAREDEALILALAELL